MLHRKTSTNKKKIDFFKLFKKAKPIKTKNKFNMFRINIKKWRSNEKNNARDFN